LIRRRCLKTNLNFITPTFRSGIGTKDVSKGRNMKLLLNLYFLFFSAWIVSCNTTEPPIPPDETKPILALELDDAHCTEAWLQLTTKDLVLPAELTLKQYNPTGDSLSQIFILHTQDSLLYIDSLFPNQNYKFKVALNTTDNPQPTTNLLPVTTMDTTRHNFTFEMITFGGAVGSSVLYDVAIINENNIWAVGEIWIADTSSLGYTKYNAVHWDGNNWELKQLLWNNSVFSPIRGILALDENNFYFSAGSIFKWDGSSTNVQMVFSRLSLPEPNGTIEKLWGESTNNIYGVGYVGSLVHCNGQSWQRIESNTTLNINDIWGDYNEKTNEWEILAVASNYGNGWEKEILDIKLNQVNKLATNSNPAMEPLLTVWFKTNRQYYVAGAGIYQKRKLTDDLWKNNNFDITDFATTSIKGTEINDVLGVGAFGDFLHYNGISWKSDYQGPLLSSGSYGSVKIKDNIIVATGYNNNEAVILIGRR